MRLDKAQARDKKHRQARHGMRVNGRSVFTIQAAIIERAQAGTQAESAGGKRGKKRGKRSGRRQNG